MAKTPAVSKEKAEKPKRLTPTPEVLRQLYVLSGNQCAMPGCDHLMIDGNGVVVGHICHIQAAMPDGARFNPKMDNEQRREVGNLLLMCGGHHKQIDSRAYEAEYTLAKVTKIKTDHEAKLKGVGASLRKAFQKAYTDVTDSLAPTTPRTFVRIEAALPDLRLRPDEELKRRKDFANFVDSMSVVPPDDREFILAIIRRAIKLGNRDAITVHVDDVESVLGLSSDQLKKKGDSLERYKVGDIDLYATDRDTDEYHVRIKDPSGYLTWYDIDAFCKKEGLKLEDLVLHLGFGALDA